ncbi:hybrid cluster protein-associated redox disulfide domain-containing protein [Clostridium amylolyticum]|uniref:Hybrid cluster protein-associated redox disulfide domain-containing protein n=1 Tax=Clostridium amylolyticum TaxID=1121298 RepID=A0A1M6IJX7_9CLOT|nr:DUF1858 domain-containing protein [Clostridium amylolyticum]SHJ34766.1 hybrid cluster protein-associated redox disulfide domain-containing protein [Clostridium amylolyticum]
MKITKEITIGELVRNYPEAIDILMDFGMGCIGCPASQAESIQDAALVHGLNVNDLLNALNEKLEK